MGVDGTSHVVPVGWSHSVEHDAIEIRGHDLERTKKYRDAQRTGRAVIVIDDLASTDPWRPRGVEIGGPAELVDAARPLIRVGPGTDALLGCLYAAGVRSGARRRGRRHRSRCRG